MSRLPLLVLALFPLLLTSAPPPEVPATEGVAPTELEVAPASIPSFFDHYSTFDEMVSFLQSLAVNHSSVAHLEALGSTLEGRPIWGLRISNEPTVTNVSKPTVIVEAQHHAREWMTTEVVVHLAHYILENYQTDPSLWHLINTTQVWLIPKVNADGYVYDGDGNLTLKQMWRKNRRDNGDGTFGVDLNRNYDWSWERGDPNTASNIYHGTAPFSEPETRAVRDLALASNTSVYLAYHSYTQLILYPWGDTRAKAPDDLLLRKLAFEMQARIPNVAGNGFPYRVMQAINLYPAYGTSMDWFYGALGALSFTVELYPASFGQGGFYPPEAKIPAVVQDHVAAALYLMGAAHAPWESLMDLDAVADTATTDAGSNATFQLTVRNHAYDPVTFRFAAQDVPADWNVFLPSVNVAAGGVATVDVDVQPRWDTPGATYVLNLTAAIEGYEKASETVAVRVAVNPIERVVGVSVTPPPDRTAGPGTQATLDFRVNNTGNVEDTFSLSVRSERGWGLSAPLQVTVPAGSGRVVPVDVHVPANTLVGVADSVTLSATSQADPSVQASDSTSAVVGVQQSLAVSAPSAASAFPDDVVGLAFGVENRGNGAETVLLEVASDAGWLVSAPASIALPPFATAVVQARVTVPTTALAGASTSVEIRATSTSDPTVKSVATASVGVLRRSEVELVGPPLASAEPAETLALNFTVWNLGNAEEIILLEAEGATGWTVEGPSAILLGAFSNATVTYSLKVSETAPAGSVGTLSVTASSTADPMVRATRLASVTVNQVYGLLVVPRPSSVTVDPTRDGYTVALRFEVANLGNGADTATPSFRLPAGWTTAEPVPVNIGPWETATLSAAIQIDAAAGAGAYAVALSVLGDQGPPAGATAGVTLLRPDLVLLEVAVGETEIVVPGPVAVTAWVGNVGRGIAPPAAIAVYREGASEPLSTSLLDSLPPGSLGRVDFEVELPPGATTLTVVVDPADLVVEEDETVSEQSVGIVATRAPEAMPVLVALAVPVAVGLAAAVFLLWRWRAR